MLEIANADGNEIDLEGGPDAVLLLHGLTGSTFEVAYLAEAFHAAGMRCLAPVMAGHGGATKDLAGVPWTEWVAKASRDLARLEGARRTIIVGCSMGALVACELAHDRPEKVDGIVLLAPALELQWQGKLAASLGRAALLRNVVVPKGSGSDVKDAAARAANPCLDGVPLGAVAELEALQAHVVRQLPGIAAPALVVAGAHDHTVTLRGAEWLARRIGSGPAELLVLPESFHLVGVDVERERCAERALAFVETLPVPGRPPARSTARTPARRPAKPPARKAGKPGKVRKGATPPPRPKKPTRRKR